MDGFIAAAAANVLAASDRTFAIWLVLVGSLTLAAGTTAFRKWRWTRLIEDIPTAKTRSAHQGYVELQGTAEWMEGPPIKTPVSRRDCVWWDLTVEKRTRDGWSRRAREVSEELFALRDDTGSCIVDPEGARVFSLHRRVTMSGAPKIAAGLSEGRYRNTERFIVPGDPLYVIGIHETLKGVDHWDNEAELVEKLRQWKANQDELKRRFDEDRDGRIDEHEWARARRAARAEVQREHREASVQPGVSVMRAPADRRPFLIAADDQTEYLRRLRRIMIATGISAIAGTACLLALISLRFGG